MIIYCRTCDSNFESPSKRGRPPVYCEECRKLPKKGTEVKTKLNAEERIDRLTLDLKARGMHISQHQKNL